MENNKDLMGWNAPGSNNSSDEEKKREQSSQDPWGRESRRSSADDLLSGLLKSLKDLLGLNGKRSSSRKKTVPNLSVPGVKNVSISKTRSDLVRSAMQNYMKQKKQSDLTAAYKAQLDEIDKNPFMTQKIRAAQKAKIKERFGIN